MIRPLYALARRAVWWRHGVLAGRKARELARWERRSADDVRGAQLDLLRHVCTRAFHDVPYYRAALERDRGGVWAFRDVEAFRTLPLLDRDRLRSERERLVATDRAARGAAWDATGGSTGEPVRFLRSRASQAWMVANEERMWRWYGVRPGARQAFLWGADRDVPPDEDERSLRARLLAQRRFNAFLLTDERCEFFARRLADFRPDMVYGYGSALRRFARWLGRAGIRVPAPIAIRSTADVLAPEGRELVADAFGAPVYDYYGARDAGPIAGECSEGDGLHVFSDLVWVEILDELGRECAPGVSGEVVVTRLREHAMPLIRYRTGDRASWVEGPCACGRPFPRLRMEGGRIGEFVVWDNGKDVHGEYFTHLFYGVDGAVSFQVRQLARRRLVIDVEWEGGGFERTAEKVRRSVLAHLGENDPDTVEVRRVSGIEPTASGKHRFVIGLDA